MSNTLSNGPSNSEIIKQAIKDLNVAFEEFKKTHNDSLNDLKNQQSDPLVLEKINKLHAEMDAKTAVIEKEKKAKPTTNRPYLSHTDHDRDDLENHAFSQFLKTGSIRGFAQLEKKYLNTDAPEEGGVFLPNSIYTTIASSLEDICPMMALANVIILDSSKGNIYRYPRMKKEFDEYWQGEKGKNRWSKAMEADDKAGSKTPEIEMKEIHLHAINYTPRISSSLMESSHFDVLSWLRTGLIEYIGMLCNDAFIHGDGIKKPKGITHADHLSDAPEKYKIQKYKTGKNADFNDDHAYETLLNLMTSLDPRYAKEAQWFVSSEVMKKIRLIKTPGEDRYLWSPEQHSAGHGSSFMGCPVTVCDALKALSENSISMFFGNFKQAYTIVHRPNMSILRDEWTAKPDVEVLLRFAFGGDVTNGDALKALQFCTE